MINLSEAEVLTEHVEISIHKCHLILIYILLGGKKSFPTCFAGPWLDLKIKLTKTNSQENNT